MYWMLRQSSTDKCKVANLYVVVLGQLFTSAGVVFWLGKNCKNGISHQSLVDSREAVKFSMFIS